MNGFMRRFFRQESGAITVDWVVLSALAVTLLAAGYGSLQSSTTSLAGATATYMGTYH